MAKKSRLFRKGDDFFHFLHHIIVIFPFVGYKATGAILNPTLGIAEISSAFVPQGIQGAIAKQAVKIFSFFAIMAGKIFTFPVLKKLIMLHFILQIPSTDTQSGDRL